MKVRVELLVETLEGDPETSEMTARDIGALVEDVVLGHPDIEDVDIIRCYEVK